jgi:hypothetical protein
METAGSSDTFYLATKLRRVILQMTAILTHCCENLIPAKHDDDDLTHLHKDEALRQPAA